MVPPEAFSISLAHSCVAGTSGCAGGIHSEILSWTSLSCADAGAAITPPAATPNRTASATLFIIGLPKARSSSCPEGRAKDRRPQDRFIAQQSGAVQHAALGSTATREARH